MAPSALKLQGKLLQRAGWGRVGAGPSTLYCGYAPMSPSSSDIEGSKSIVIQALPVTLADIVKAHKVSPVLVPSLQIRKLRCRQVNIVDLKITQLLALGFI